MAGRKLLLGTFVLFLAASLLTTTRLHAIQITATPVGTVATNEPTADVAITSPLLVSELHGTVEVQGTANIPNMDSYFLEVRSLVEDASLPADNVPWIPITLPVTGPVQNGLLASWDTTTVPDGLYELRLTVTANNVQSESSIITPLRINNAAFTTPTPVAILPTATPIPLDTTPRVTAVVSANVRLGDSTIYPVIAFLVHDDSAQALGISSTGSGWYFVRLSSGIVGWISPFVVVTSGDFSGVGPVNPPPVPVLPTPTATPVLPNLVLNGIGLNPGSPTCGDTFNVVVNVSNIGNGRSDASTISVQDVHVASGAVITIGATSVPPLGPGTSFTATIPLVVTAYYGEEHQLRANLGDSQITTNYLLMQGSCNVPATRLPTATATSVPPTATPLPPAAKLTINGMSLNPSSPACGAAFNVTLNVVNTGNGRSDGATVFVQDVHQASGAVVTSGAGFVPPLDPGASYTVGIPLIATAYYNEDHQIRAVLGGSQAVTTYRLVQGRCAVPLAVVPSATFTPIPPTPTFTETPVPPSPTRTFTPVPPTATKIPPTPTATKIPPTPTATNTSTFTHTPVPPTLTPTTVLPTAAQTAVPPTASPEAAVVTATVAQTASLVPTTASGADMLNAPYVDLSDPAVPANIKQIYAKGKGQSVKPDTFAIVGDTTLAGVRSAADAKTNLDQFKDVDAPLIKFFAPGFSAMNGSTTKTAFTSADILNPAKGSGPCQKKAPLACALEAKPVVVFLAVGRNDITAKVPLDQFTANLVNAVNMTVNNGSIPVLVTIPAAANSADDPMLAQYNAVISNVAKVTHIPLLNLYHLKTENGDLINPTNGTLTGGANKPLDFTPVGLKIGNNFAAKVFLEMLSALKNAIPLP